MPVLGPPISTAVVGSAATGVSGSGVAPPPLPGTKIPPLADSAVVYEFSYSTGTGPYSLAGAYGSWKEVGDSYDDGSIVYYRATDSSSRTEYVIGTFNAAAQTLTRDRVLGSTDNGNPINWNGRTRVLIHALVQGLPLCTVPPQDGQVLAWDAATNEYCPKDISIPQGPDDDTADMQDITTGVSYTTVLSKPVTQLVWLSTDAGDKVSNIPQCEASINGYSLDVKTTLGNGDNHFIVPAGGTIAGLANLTFTDAMCNAFLRCDGQRNDWILRCLCCTTPMSGTPTPPSTGGGAPGAVVDAGGVHSYVDPSGAQGTVINSRSINITTSGTNEFIALHVGMNSETGPTPSVASVVGGGLTWTHRISASSNPNYAQQYYGVNEYWWAIAPTPLTSEPITVTVASGLGWITIQYIGVKGINTSSPFDTNPSLPVVATNGGSDPATVTQISGISTTSANTVVLALYDDWLGACAIAFDNGTITMNKESVNSEVQAFINLGIDSAMFDGIATSPLSNANLVFNQGNCGSGPRQGWAIIVDALKPAP